MLSGSPSTADTTPPWRSPRVLPAVRSTMAAESKLAALWPVALLVEILPGLQATSVSWSPASSTMAPQPLATSRRERWPARRSGRRRVRDLPGLRGSGVPAFRRHELGRIGVALVGGRHDLYAE